SSTSISPGAWFTHDANSIKTNSSTPARCLLTTCWKPVGLARCLTPRPSAAPYGCKTSRRARGTWIGSGIAQAPHSQFMLDVFFPFAGGLGLFLIGMMLLSEGLVAFAGGSLQRVLVAFTGTPLKAFGSGALITALAQSSTATTVTLIGFVSAGLITF